jgi:hypothetical protein
MKSDTTDLTKLLSVIINVVIVLFDMMNNLIVRKNIIKNKVWNANVSPAFGILCGNIER